VIGVLVISFCIRGLDVIWHGFSPNNAYNFRYSFILSYVLLVIAQYGWARRKAFSRVWIGVTGAVLLVLCAGLLGMKHLMGLDFISPTGLAISAGVTVVTTLYLLLGEQPRRLASLLFALACLFEVGANYYLCINEARKESYVLQLADYQSFVQRTRPAVDAVKNMDSGFYRMEKTFQRNKNDAMGFSYNGLTHFSSSQDKAVPRFMEQLGMTSMEGIWSEYGTGSTVTVDTLLGVKYVLSRSDLTEKKGYLYRDTVNDIGIYENPDVLPIAFVSDTDILNADPTQEDCFSLQNRMLSGITGTQVEGLLPVQDATVTLENLTQTEAGVYVKENPEAEASLTYAFTASHNLPLYVYFYAPCEQAVSLYINGEYSGSYFSPYRWDIVYAGTYEPGDRVEIALVPNAGELMVEKALFSYEDAGTVSAAAQGVRENPVQLRRETSSHLTGSCTAEDEGLLLFTIPYDTGWKLTVDGKPAEYIKVLDVFMAAPVTPGSHTFELRYVPRGSLAGCAITAAALAVAALWFLREKKCGLKNNAC